MRSLPAVILAMALAQPICAASWEVPATLVTAGLYDSHQTNKADEAIRVTLVQEGPGDLPELRYPMVEGRRYISVRIQRGDLPAELQALYPDRPELRADSFDEGGIIVASRIPGLAHVLTTCFRNSPTDKSPRWRLRVENSFGEPAAGYEASLSSWAHTMSATVGEDGGFECWWPDELIDKNYHTIYGLYGPRSATLTVTEPISGQQSKPRIPCDGRNDPTGPEGATVAVPIMSPEDLPLHGDRILCGRILNADGTPARAALGTFNLSREGWTDWNKAQISQVWIPPTTTGPEGDFFVAIFPRMLNQPSHEPVPDFGVTFNATIEVDHGEVATVPMQPGKWHEHRLPIVEKRTFQVAELGGAFRKFKKGDTVGICRASREDEPPIPIQLRYEELDDRLELPAVPVPGWYSIHVTIVERRDGTARGQSELTTKPRLLEPGHDGETVVFERNDDTVTISGRVLDGEGPAPLAGAWVAAGNSGDLGHELANLPDLEREELWASRTHPLTADAIPLPGVKFSPRSVARSDADGHFALKYPAGLDYHVAVWMPGRMPVSGSAYVYPGDNAKPPATEIDVGSCFLFPLAKAEITILPDGLGDATAKLQVGAPALAASCEGYFMAGLGGYWGFNAIEAYPEAVSPGIPFPLSVPAGRSWSLAVEQPVYQRASRRFCYLQEEPLAVGETRAIAAKLGPVGN